MHGMRAYCGIGREDRKMVCKRCGEEVEEKNIFCPKCGKRLQRAGEKKKIIGILSFVCMLLAAGAGLYIVKHLEADRQPDSVEVNIAAAEGVGMEIFSQETNNFDIETDKAAGTEEITEVPDELKLYLWNLSFESVEMIMGETHSIELEKEIPDAVWTSSDEKIVRVVEGRLDAVTPGKAVVTLSADGESCSCNVTVCGFEDMTLAVGHSKSMEMNDAFSEARWESSAPEIVSVENGVITSLASGAAAVTAYLDGIPYSFEVVATTPDITTTSVRKIIGNTEQVSILGTNGKTEWKSDNMAIATVSDTGVITAEPTGAGQSTVVHVFVDGMEFQIDVAVEPIPQLSSTYKMYGHQDDYFYKNARVAICTNADETVTFSYREDNVNNKYFYRERKVENVLNVADADYSSGNTYPLYYAFYDNDNESYTDVYLVGTSQKAEVLVQQMKYWYNIEDNADGVELARSVAIYEPCENYGIIHIYNRDSSSSGGNPLLITVSVDGYQYQFVMRPPNIYGMGEFSYMFIDNLPPDYMIEECSVDEIVVPEKVNVDYSALQANSRSYIPGNEWMERIGTKFVEAVEDQAIEMAAGALLKAIFL